MGSDGFQNTRIFRDMTHPLVAADEVPMDGRDDQSAVFLQTLDVFLSEFICVHFFVHRRYNNKGCRACEHGAGQNIIRQAVCELRDDVRGSGREFFASSMCTGFVRPGTEKKSSITGFPAKL